MDSEEIFRLISSERLMAICPKADPAIVETLVTDAPDDFQNADLTTIARIAHFVAQIATETRGLTRLDENLNYTTADRLTKVFPSKFATAESAKPFLHNPEKLANHVYAGKNGNKDGGDGWLYRGSGLIQLTGRGNFRDVGKLVHMPLENDPELARQPDSALRIALGYWAARKINSVANDAGDAAVTNVTKLINPALVGLAERKSYFRKAMKILTVAPSSSTGAARGLGAVRETDRPFAPAAISAASGPDGSVCSLSGPAWVERFPTSRLIDDLAEPFRTNLRAFVDALRGGRATVRISATLRPKQRAYLMHWAWKIAKGAVDPVQVPPMEGVGICWTHGSAPKSVTAAKQMVRAFGMVQVAALNSRHIDGKAVDMTIAWTGRLSIDGADGAKVQIADGPRNGSNPRLITLGHGYKVIKLVTDPPHWSDDGR